MKKRVPIALLIWLELSIIFHPFTFSIQTAQALTVDPSDSPSANKATTSQQLSSLISGPLRVSTVNPRYFADPSGNIVYLTGSHTWCNFQDCDDTNPIVATFDYTAYLDFLVGLNHNFFRLWRGENARGGEAGPNFWFSPMPYQRSNTCCAFDGGNKFNLNTFNQSYFDRMRQRIIQAGDRGIYVSVMLFDGWSVESKVSNHNPWDGHPYNISNNINSIDGDSNNDNQGGETHTLALPQITAIQKAYVKKVIDTVNDLDNVLYEISNESPPNSEAWQYHMINFIKDYEETKPNQHPVGMTWEWPAGNNNDLYNSPADWISLGGNVDINTYVPPVANGSKVIIADTDHLCGICGNRQWVWKSFTRGENPIFMDIYDNNATSGRGKLLFNPNEVEIRNNLGPTRSYANQMNLAAMTPQPALCSTGFCLASAGSDPSEYLVYLPSGGSVNVNLSAVPNPLTVEWFRPANGTTTTGTNVNGGATRTLTAPFSGDAVLYLKEIVPPPAHDTFAGAKAIDAVPYLDSFRSSGAAIDGDGPAVPGLCDGRSLRKGTKNVWYRFTPTETRFVAFDTFGTVYDTYLAVWTGPDVGSLTLVACDDNQSGLQSQVGMVVQANTTYHIEVAQYNGTLPNGPTSIPTGGNAAFHVTSFKDVPGNLWGWMFIEGFYDADITTGCSVDPMMYCPNAYVTRGEMAVFIERALGTFTPTPDQTDIFADVPYQGQPDYFQAFIEEFYIDGITAGCAENPLRYCPQNNVTRGEMAVFIERALGNFDPNPGSTGMFADVPHPAQPAYFQNFIEQFYLDGITTGCATNPLRYCPQNYVTRQEMAVFIVRAFGIPLP